MRVDNNPLTGEWPVTIVNQILKQMPALAKPQAKFLTFLFAIVLGRRGRSRRYDGKVDFADLSRFQYLGTVEKDAYSTYAYVTINNEDHQLYIGKNVKFSYGNQECIVTLMQIKHTPKEISAYSPLVVMLSKC